MRKTKPDVAILPMLQNATDGKWDGPGLARMLADPQKRRARLESLVEFLQAASLQGVVVDFEQVPKEAQPTAIAFLREMRALFKPRGWLTVVATPIDDDDWPYAEYAKAADYQMLMAYDEHYEEGEPGPIASQVLVRRHAQPAHEAARSGAYHRCHRQLRLRLVRSQAGRGRDLPGVRVWPRAIPEAAIELDPQSLNPHFDYSNDDGTQHQVWFLDAVTAFNQIRAADVFHPAGYALWRLGSEDPSIWSVFGRNYNAAAPAALENIAPGNDIDFQGEGEILEGRGRSGGRRPHFHARQDASHHRFGNLHEDPDLLRHPPHRRRCGQGRADLR